jgi:SAM-dependent methyltransferase
MPWKYSEEYYREYTRTTWNESAEPYVRLMGQLDPYRADLVTRLAAKSGEHVLDLGTGPGEPAMTLAEGVGSRGHVTGVDLSEKMVEIATRVAKARQLSNVDFQTMDCTALTFPEGSFDAVCCSFGFQIFTDPEKAAREALRVLRPGGRIGAAVWSTGDQVPFLDVIIQPMLEHAEPDESGYLPTPYETGGPGELVAFLQAAGFQEGREERVHHSLHFDSPEAYLDSLLKGTPIGHSLSEEEPARQQEILEKAPANLKAWTGPDGITLPAECVIATARR